MHAKPNRDTVPQVINGRINGRFAPGYSGNPGGSPEAARKALNKDTILEMHRAFKLGGRKAIEEVMRNQPAVFLKLLVLLVPREMQVERTGGVKAMSDEQLEQAIEALEGFLAKREAGANAKVVEGVAEPIAALPAPSRKARSKARRTEGEMRADMGKPDETGNLNRPRPARQGWVGPREPKPRSAIEGCAGGHARAHKCAPGELRGCWRRNGST
jgi:hypothetical protein